ncbi:MAG: PilZ domain-containing protein [Duganella sp.]
MSADSPPDPFAPLSAAQVRPTVLSLAIREKAALYAAYMPFLKHGGLFIATPKPHKLGDEIFVILTLMDESTKHQIAGKVVWITPAGAHHDKAQGVGIHFPDDETGQGLRQRIEEILGPALRSARATHTL